MDVSIVIPVYNMEAFIEKGVASVESQTHKSIEIILVNDGSKDHSGEICDRVAAKYDNVRVIHTSNHGSGPARNTGIAESKGDYLYFFDIDDTLEPNTIETLLAAARESDSDIVVCGFKTDRGEGSKVVINERRNAELTGEQVRREYDRYMYGELGIQGAPWNKLFRRDFIVRNKVEYPDLRRNQDEVFIMRAVNSAKRIRIISDVLYHHYGNTNERMLQKYRLDYDENVGMLYRYFDMMLAWNPDNQKMLSILRDQYYINMIVAMKVVFSPKWTLSFSQSYSEIKKRHRAYLENCVRYGDPWASKAIRESKFWPLVRCPWSLPLYVALRANTVKKRRSGE